MKEIYKAKGVLEPNCCQSHITYTFHLDKHYKNMTIKWSYDKGVLNDEKLNKAIILNTIERDCKNNFSEETYNQLVENWEEFSPLKNLLTLSMYDENDFRGASHHSCNDELFTISENEASFGYIAGIIPCGKVEITISIHSLVKECEYNLLVCVGGGDCE